MKSQQIARAHKKSSSTDGSLWKWGAGAAVAGAAAAAVYNSRKARRAERENPPLGKFIDVDGVRLHYLERGEGDPVVLLHGNGTMIEDWIVSGVLDDLAKDRRVIAFDRPGFGHSERPRSRIWTPSAQAALIAKALTELKVEKPLVAGHSFGTLVALALGLNHPEAVSKLVLLGGYFYASVRADVLFVSQPAVPVVGDVMRYTVSPLIGAAMLPRINARIFNPAPVPARWLEEFPLEMTLRPSQIRAESAEAAMMIPAAAALAPRYAELDLPVTIVAGKGDELVTPAGQSELLHQALPKSRYVPVEGAGHMVHHTATSAVLSAIRRA
jgi:pimeloyl-ACP methyl ester carboxylesterase